MEGGSVPISSFLAMEIMNGLLQLHRGGITFGLHTTEQFSSGLYLNLSINSHSMQVAELKIKQ